MAIEKGARVQIKSGRAEGVAGTVFWKGENKWGPGERLGVRGDDGQTHWIDSAEVTPTDAAVPDAPTFSRGDRVAFRQGAEEGIGTVFWTGQNRHGPGQRLGIHPDGGDPDSPVWLDALATKALNPADDPGPPVDAAPRGGGGGGGYRGSGGGGGRSDDVAEIPHDYSAPMSMDELPPVAPLDDGDIDQMAAWVDDDDDPPPPF